MNSIGLLTVRPNKSSIQQAPSGEATVGDGLRSVFKDLMKQENLEKQQDESGVQDKTTELLSTLKDLNIDLTDENLKELEALTPELQALFADMLQNGKAMEDSVEGNPTELITVLLQSMKNSGGMGEEAGGEGLPANAVMANSSEKMTGYFRNQQAVLMQQVEGDLLPGHAGNKAFQVIWEQAQKVLAGIEGNIPTTEQEATLKKLLQQWIHQEKSAGTTNNSLAVTSEPGSKGETKLQNVWQQLVSAFRSRENLSSQKRYSGNSTVTTADIGKWVRQALAKQAEEGSQKQPITMQQTASSMPVSKIEQYVVHLNQTGSQEANQKQLTETLQKAILESNFLKSNGAKELSLKLRPAQMGEVMIKMTQLNGEMTVKITVTSQAAKDLLEGNVHQLKHMFSPQQVVVEKQDAQFLQQDNNRHAGQQNSSSTDQSDQESGFQDESRESSEEETDGKSFAELLMYEKV
ncbi:flagellar hook-length control protein FliK [Virgibacillus senegalensis]|uniref:flagellar hook-length control protein FliK n=1 Tax=Virgibacillus senegalensis TaxID=1499679 RepID=UPI00069F78C9|nr:flagellar hook-length control protein FliK [Virgibacillus senegalensis]